MENNDSTTWREQLRELGKEEFVIQEMARLGFLKLPLDKVAELKENYKQLNQLNAEISKLNKQLEGIEDITPILKQIRQKRIERVRAERAVRKLEKIQEKQVKQHNREEKRKNTPFYLGKGVSKFLKFESETLSTLETNNLPIINDIKQFAEKINLSREELLWLAYHRQSATIDHYTRFRIPKKKGGYRTIASPKGKMRLAQSWIRENILEKIPIHHAATAFTTQSSVVKNAEQHVGAEILVRIDLKDFFPSIQFHRVRGLFHSLGYNLGMATVLGLLCTDSLRLTANINDKRYFVALGERYLPQGATTSPAITNLICRKLDNRLQHFAQKNQWRYTRYADDLVFSTSNKEANLGSFLHTIKLIVEEESFKINEEKTLITRPHQRQVVTGVLINNQTLRIPRKNLRNFRAFLHQYQTKGVTEMSKILGKDATSYGKGYYSFVKMVNPTQAEGLAEQAPWLKS